MLHIQISNPEPEDNIDKISGNERHSLEQAFSMFMQQHQANQDVKLSQEQLEQGKGIEMKQVIADIRERYG